MVPGHFSTPHPTPTPFEIMDAGTAAVQARFKDYQVNVAKAAGIGSRGFFGEKFAAHLLEVTRRSSSTPGS